MQILVVEDEPQMAALLAKTFQEDGHQVVVSHNGREGFAIARNAEFDVIVLDLMLPGMDGFVVAKRLREMGRQTPVLMLTARDATSDIVRGLDSGADDYLIKPFSIDVLLARVRAVSRRGAIPRPTVLKVANVTLDPGSHKVTRGNEVLNLTPREYRLLELLMRSAGRAVSRDTILESVWGFETEVTENTVEVFVRALRLKVDTREPKLIQTVRGFGYIMQEP